ncbi:MAG: hypothetical protein WD850_02405 [Candidatus Spechtbacterales bacterium]
MIQVRIVNTEQELFSGEVSKIVAPGSQGQFTVLPGHVPFLTTLTKGAILVSGNGAGNEIGTGDDKFFEVSKGGVFELAPGDQATILLS